MLRVLVQRSENTNLQKTGLGNDIGDRVALFVPQITVVASGHGDGGFGAGVQAQTGNHIVEKFAKMAGAFVIVQ